MSIVAVRLLDEDTVKSASFPLPEVSWKVGIPKTKTMRHYHICEFNRMIVVHDVVLDSTLGLGSLQIAVRLLDEDNIESGLFSIPKTTFEIGTP